MEVGVVLILEVGVAMIVVLEVKSCCNSSWNRGLLSSIRKSILMLEVGVAMIVVW